MDTEEKEKEKTADRNEMSYQIFSIYKATYSKVNLSYYIWLDNYISMLKLNNRNQDYSDYWFNFVCDSYIELSSTRAPRYHNSDLK